MNAAAQAATLEKFEPAIKSIKRTSSLAKLSGKQKNSKIGDAYGTDTDSNVNDENEDKIVSIGNLGGFESDHLD